MTGKKDFDENVEVFGEGIIHTVLLIHCCVVHIVKESIIEWLFILSCNG